MAKRASKRAQRTPGDRAPGNRPARAAAAPEGVARLVQNTVLTALAGARDVGSEVGSVAVSAVRGSIRAAGEIGADVGRLALSVAAGALDAADRITAAAGRVASNLVEPSLPGLGVTGAARPRGDRRVPGQRAVSRSRRRASPPADTLPENSDAYARRPAAAARKPLARSPARVERRAQPGRPRRRAG